MQRASEDVVTELLDERLAPVLRELVAAIVRFDWYFQPLEPGSEGRKLVLDGLSTTRSDLDARLLVNMAERHVVGIAWFLALHMLQPRERRRVLVLDDPTGAFDAVNRAGFLATLRAFVRLIKPEQVVITTHDELFAAQVAEEFAPVNGWPRAVTRIRCQRNADDASTTSVEGNESSSRGTEEEIARLGLADETTLFPAEGSAPMAPP